MRRKIFIIAILIGSFFICKNIKAVTWAPPAVAINEICWMGSASSASDEWFELYNNTDNDIDLTGWKIMVSSTELTYKNFNNIISAHDYYLLERTDDNSAPTVLADAIYNGSVSLSNTGGSIKILNSDGQIIDWLQLWPWPKGNNDTKQTMERISANVAADDETNWQDSLTVGGTPGAANSNLNSNPIEKQNPQVLIKLSTNTIRLGEQLGFDGSDSYDPDGVITDWLWNFGDGNSVNIVSGTYGYFTTGTFVVSLDVKDSDNLDNITTTSVEVLDSTQETTSTPITTTTFCDWNKIKLNEIVSDPESGNEWVELYNLDSGICNLSGGVICDNTEDNCKIVSGTMMRNNFLLVDLGTNRYLNNDADSVILKNNQGERVDFVNYGSGSLGAPEKAQSLARINDGIDTNNNSNWALTTIITPGATNIIKNPTSTNSNGSASSGGSSSNSASVNIVKNCYAGQPIILYELFPNPIGDDEIGEYIKLKNISSSTINLKYWKLEDSSKSFDLLGEIKTGEVLNFVRASTSIALNNSTKEEVKLIDPCDRVVDKINYDKAEENFVYRQESGKWYWYDLNVAASSTPVKIIDINKAKIIWDFDFPESIVVGEKIQFDASRSADPRGGELKFIWEFGDGKKVFGNRPQIIFTTSGVNNILVTASSSLGTIGETDFSVLVKNAVSSSVKGILISAVMANPDGVDADEFIKINNISTSSVDVSNWRLVYKNKYFVIPSSTIFVPNSSLTFFKAVTKFSLSNSGGEIELWDDKNQVVSTFNFGKAKSGVVARADAENKDETKSVGKKFIYSTIKNVREKSVKGDLVIVRGEVVVLPGVFGSQYFYITDKESGIQIYEHNKKFPDLKIGDEIEVWGEVSQSGEIKRIKVTTAGKIKKLNYNYPVVPTVFKINDLGELELGRLIKISGEVTQVKSSFVYIDDDSGELKVYFKPGARIAAKSLVVGEKVDATGILEDSASGLQFWPRSPEDINIIGSVSYDNAINTSTSNQSKSQAEEYLVATGGGVTALFLGLLARSRGTILLSVAKKTADFASKIIRRG